MTFTKSPSTMSTSFASTTLSDGFPYLESSAVSDVLEGLGLSGRTLSQRFRPFGRATRFIGRAACAVLTSPSTTAALGQPKEYFAAIDEMSTAGVVMVIQVPDGTPGALMGGFMAREFQRRGAHGLLTNGLVRDADELSTLAFPVAAFGTTPCNGARNMVVASVGEPVRLPGEGATIIQVYENDLVVGDLDGVIVVPAALAELVIAATRELSRIERLIAQAMAHGSSRLDAMRKHDRFAHLQAAREEMMRENKRTTYG